MTTQETAVVRQCSDVPDPPGDSPGGRSEAVDHAVYTPARPAQTPRPLLGVRSAGAIATGR